jgi:hypothetical protein
MRLLFTAVLDYTLFNLSVHVPEPVAMRGLFGAIAANRHAAPSSRTSARMVGK